MLRHFDKIVDFALSSLYFFRLSLNDLQNNQHDNTEKSEKKRLHHI